MPAARAKIAVDVVEPQNAYAQATIFFVLKTIFGTPWPVADGHGGCDQLSFDTDQALSVDGGVLAHMPHASDVADFLAR